VNIAYVASNVANSVFQFDVGRRGGLSPKRPASVPAGTSPFGLAVSADGRSVYVTNANSDDVSQYSVGAGGRLVPKSPASVATDDLPVGVAVNPAVRIPKDQCKQGGWRSFPQFKNQGDCVSFVEKAS